MVCQARLFPWIQPTWVWYLSSYYDLLGTAKSNVEPGVTPEQCQVCHPHTHTQRSSLSLSFKCHIWDVSIIKLGKEYSGNTHYKMKKWALISGAHSWNRISISGQTCSVRFSPLVKSQTGEMGGRKKKNRKGTGLQEQKTGTLFSGCSRQGQLPRRDPHLSTVSTLWTTQLTTIHQFNNYFPRAVIMKSTPPSRGTKM